MNADGWADVASGQVVSGNYYSGLGVQPILGRTLTDEDDKAGADPVAVLSYRYCSAASVAPARFEGTMQGGSTEDVTIAIAWEPQMYVDADDCPGAPTLPFFRC